MRLQRGSCVYIVKLCREIVVNNSRTSLKLLHSSEIGASAYSHSELNDGTRVNIRPSTISKTSETA